MYPQIQKEDSEEEYQSFVIATSRPQTPVKKGFG